MAFDTKAWLTELKFNEDEIKDLMPRFSGEREALLEKNQLRLPEFSKKMNDLQKAQDAVAAAEAKLNGEMAEWAELTAAEKASAGDLRKKLDDSEARVFQLTQRATRLAEEAGVDPKTILGDGEPPVDPKLRKEPVTVDLDPLRHQIGGIADYMLTLNAELPAIAQEHFELTGKRLDTRAFIASIKADLKTGKKTAEDLDPVRRWEAEFKIPELRATKATEERAKERAADRAEGRAAALSEAALPNTQTRPLTHSPAFRTVDGTKSKLERPQPGQKMAGAIAALATGKYRGKGGSAAA
jgi:hypothetical protein